MGVTGAAVALTATGTALGVGAQLSAGEFNAAQSRRDRLLARQKAVFAERKGVEEERRTRALGRRVGGAQRAALAGQGLDVNIGSAIDVREDTRRAVEQDILTIRNNTALQVWGYENQADQFAVESRLAQRRGALGAASTILGGATDIALAVA